MINKASINTFQKGHSFDNENHAELNETFSKGKNGRLYSHNGKIAFSSIKGSKLIYQNDQVVKYLGYHSFDDELIVFAKVLKPEDEEEIPTEPVTERVITSNDFTVFVEILNEPEPDPEPEIPIYVLRFRQDEYIEDIGVFYMPQAGQSHTRYLNQLMQNEDDEGFIIIELASILHPNIINMRKGEAIVWSGGEFERYTGSSPGGGGSFINEPFFLTNQLLINSKFETVTTEVDVKKPNEFEFKLNYSCVEGGEEEINFDDYYKRNNNVPNLKICETTDNTVPLHNMKYADAFISLKPVNGTMIGTLLWIGHQNWPLNSKITTEGVEENEFYKRIYYTDAFNYRRVVNIKDKNLRYRMGHEFDQILNNVLLQPTVHSIVSGGQCKSMKALYFSRIISENGQVSEFSSSSDYAVILPENEAIEYRGGRSSESTDKLVNVNCHVMNADPTALVQCIVVEFEAFGAPTAIKNLGSQPAAPVVKFQHYGNESEFGDNLTFADIVELKNTWKYCNDFSSKKNKLIAGGLRNDPLPTIFNQLEYLMPLHSWKKDGTTHDCLMNPTPWEYRYVDPSNTSEWTYIRKKLFTSISSFGPLTLKLVNSETSQSISKDFFDIGIETYTDITDVIYEWLVTEKANNPSFHTYFPNLDLAIDVGKMLFFPTNQSIKTDMSKYKFESNNVQFIENVEIDLQFLDINVDTSKFVHGGQSVGFNQGTGIRVSFREFKEPLLRQADKIYDGTGKILDYFTPSGEKYCMKGELYRLAFEGFNNDSTRLFSIPIGDIMIPELGDTKTYIDDNGNAVITFEKYVSQSVDRGILYGHGVKMHIEVRLSCELQRFMPMYQILYVERTEENRTILCQGIAAPLMRVQHNNSEQHMMPDVVKNKWGLPYYGGPTYEKVGLLNYDRYGQDFQYTKPSDTDGDRRTMASRRLMYFDSPDLYYNRISDNFLQSSKLSIVGKLNTDHTPGVIMERGGNMGLDISFFPPRLTGRNFGDEKYPKFSRKILERQLEGNNHTDDLPKASTEERESGTYEGFFINVSVFSKYMNHNQSLDISKYITLNRGEMASGLALDVENAISNNAFGFCSQPWFYGAYQRDWKDSSSGGDMRSQIFACALTSPGYKTVFLRTTEDLFTTAFIGPDVHKVNPQIRLGGDEVVVYDTIPLINIFRNNRNSVYGGRSEEAYSRNTFIAMSKTIPVLGGSNATQHFNIGADTYVTLTVRTKNDYGEDEVIEREYNNGGGGRGKGDIKTWKRNAAWVYAVVLETQVEPKQSFNYEFYRVTNKHAFDKNRSEEINEAYFNVNNIKSYIPKPFQFKDDPNQNNVIAVSDVKLAGQNIDSWTVFKPNNFYAELEKNKGAVSNLVKEQDSVFAIQQNQTSEIYIGVDRLVTDSEGRPINIKQGSGTVVEGHKVVSDYGTKIRRATTESPFGFVFFDEKEVEFIKMTEPMFFKHGLQLHYMELFRDNPIINTESFYNTEYKESNIFVETANGATYMISYNEALACFNGIFEIKSNIFMNFDKKVFIPINDEDAELSKDLHQLNEGEYLNVLNDQKEMVIGFYVNSEINEVFIHKMTSMIVNLEYPVKEVYMRSNLGYERTLLGTHEGYKIREGIHTIPSINDSLEYYGNEDIRGSWVYVEITMESLFLNKVDILGVISSIRKSHQ